MCKFFQPGLLFLFCLLSLSLFGQNKVFDSLRLARTKLVDSLLTKLKTAKEDSSKVIVLNELALNTRSPDSAKLLQNESIELAKKVDYKRGLAKAYLTILGKDRSEWLEYQAKAFELANAIHDKNLIARYHENIGNYYDEKDWEKAFKNLNEALRLRQELGDKGYIAIIYNSIGLTHFHKRDHFEAIKNLKLSIKLYEEIGDGFTRGQIYNNLANIYMAIYDYGEAIKCYYEAAKSQDENAYSSGILGSVYAKQENYPEAINAYTESLKISELKKNDQLATAGYLQAIADMYIKQSKVLVKGKVVADSIIENLNRAKENVFKAQRIQSGIQGYPESTKKLWLVRNYILIGRASLIEAEVLKKQNKSADIVLQKLDEALKKFAEVIDLTNNERIAGLYIDIGKALTLQANFLNSSQVPLQYRLALDTIQRAISYYKQLDLKEQLRDAYSALIEVYTEIKDFKVAQEYFDLYIAIKDSLYNDESFKKLDKLKIQFAMDKATSEEQLRQEKEKTEMLLAFAKREDSIKYQQQLISMELNQQTLLSKQREQELKLKQQALSLLDKENENQRLAFLKSQAELRFEQTQRQEKEQQFTISEKEKALQANQLALQKSQLVLKENQLMAERKQKLLYIGGAVLMLLLFVFIYRNTKNRQRTDRLIAAERMKSEKANSAHKMAELELQSLRAQLNPHFMFNSLNAIQELILKEDNDNSHLYLSRFSELLRMLLDNADQPFVSLKKEINLLELYLSLENLRIPDLKYAIEIDPSIDSNRMTIPNMMLQPYIENAIWHGLSHKKSDRNLSIRISKKQDNIVCEVEDNGVGRKMSAELKSLYRKEHRSRGMELLSKRFSLLSKEYGSDIQTGIEDLHDNGTATGTRVTITVPSSLIEQFKPVYS